MTEEVIRSPIVSVLGHVDHGKSSLLDTLRGSDVTSREAGAITQAIGASKLPLEVIKDLCGPMFEQLGGEVTIPGLLFIDTPGHAAFTALRKRGGSLADLAILVVDINEGLMPQTEEAIEILRQSQTPFLIAANKVDLIPGYQDKDPNFLKSFSRQRKDVQQRIETKIYELVGQLHESFGLNAERYDRVSNYQNTLAIIPCSAIEHIGVQEVLFVLTGLAQRFLSEDLMISEDNAGRGVILEVKEDKGLGKTLDVILYDGTLSEEDTIVLGSVSEPIHGRIRALYMPAELQDSRDEKSKYKRVRKAVAATGVKVVSPEATDDVVSGMPLLTVQEGDVEAAKNIVREEVQDADIELEKEGVVIKAATLGGLEALATILNENDIPVRKATIGDITRKDLYDTRSNLETSPLYAAILGFNVKGMDAEDIAVITSDVIYELLDRYEEWRDEKDTELNKAELEKLTHPAKLMVLKNCIFRKSNPCIAGVEVLEGRIETNTLLIDENDQRIGALKSMQEQNENISEAEKGQQVAAMFPSAEEGNEIREGKILYTDLTEDEFRKFKELSEVLDENTKNIIKEIALIKRKERPLWGV